MKYLFDMVHHNPGESPCDTNFTDPAYIAGYGFNGQVFKHAHCMATFEKAAPGVYPSTDEERIWLNEFTETLQHQMRAAKEAGLAVYSHVDLFVLPAAIVEHFRDEICDPQTGRIDIERPKTLELHQMLIDELFERFPELDGLVIRVGETYLFDTPHHAGNSAVPLYDTSRAEQSPKYVKLIRFLREAICVRHEKLCIYRTWDYFTDQLHADPDYYLEVSNQVEPHEKLIFSIKHTAYDFHRWVPVNEALCRGQHQQVIEVQCQREYEGKGAFPNYTAHGVINGFSEAKQTRGLRDILPHPRVVGIYTWTRGGGWYGPYVTSKTELWCDLNAYVIAAYAQDPTQDEETLFNKYATEVLGLSGEDINRFRHIALLSLDGVVKGKCCEAWDHGSNHGECYPTNQWMRDDVMHGYDLLAPVFDFLIQNELVDAALKEKAESVAVWREIVSEAEGMNCNPPLKAVILASCTYGLRFFTFIEAAWRLLLLAREEEELDAGSGKAGIIQALQAVDSAWGHYQQLPEDHPLAATLYRDKGWNWPGKDLPDGLGASIEQVRGAISS
ncbi:MAG: hypothetical protein AB3N33_02040 [Puniceicoccaceae bacterium]